jgi:hypothetical protein
MGWLAGLLWLVGPIGSHCHFFCSIFFSFVFCDFYLFLEIKMQNAMMLMNDMHDLDI